MEVNSYKRIPLLLHLYKDIVHAVKDQKANNYNDIEKDKQDIGDFDLQLLYAVRADANWVV